MTIRKRIHMVIAALTQDWRQEICHNCGESWWTQTKALPSGMWCQSCDDENFEKWRKDFELRRSGRQPKGEVA